ncbi:VOC family protein [Quadrisphaera sp. KR29]|uniref:VOC family protein n=1 Tax=Quadrisphaera sp. KR29 TaxID=3461391 RepID=UPI0040440CB9
MARPVVHAEIIGEDPARLRAFYGALFGWDAEAGDPVAPAVSAPQEYASNPPDPSAAAVPVGIGGGRGHRAQALFYVGVSDVPACLARAVALGGAVVLDTVPRPDGTLLVAQFRDPEGNVVGLAGPVSSPPGP